MLKLIFHRRKDIADVEAVLYEQLSGFDRDYVRSTLAELVDAADERFVTLREITAEIDRGKT